MFRQASCTLFLMIVFALPALSALSASCSVKQETAAPAPNLPNPASSHCEQNGGKLQLRQDATGGVAGICVFSDGSECDEWAYFRGECKPGSKPAQSKPGSSPTTTSASRASAAPEGDGWKVYQNPKLGYTLRYPPDAVVNIDGQLGTLTITGPLSGNDNWPMIFFNHPGGRVDYRPPDGVDLEKWLTQHNLLMTGGKLGEARRPDVQIAGTRAIHTRFARSPQSFAYDKYFFVKSRQLYSLVILHTGDKEDWELYNHFIASIRFGS